jgi:TetR/AcrR family transcriptional regulator, mexJK operon transcriptional repressor
VQQLNPSPASRSWKPDDPRWQRMAEKREAILEAARPIFLREGWSGASLERVAAESGISKMTIYRHFRSKEELFEALITSMCQYMRTEAEQAPAQSMKWSLEDRLRAEALAFTAELVQPDALGIYRLIVADGWRYPALARMFEQSGLAVLRARVVTILAPLGKTPRECARRASGFVNLAFGDVYLEAAIGLEVPDISARFAEQIEEAIRFAVA